jgi:anti-sigma factor RsiW
MSESDIRLEILIGKQLDGEISPGEQKILERELAADGQARELFEQLRRLHQCSREAVASEVVEAGAGAEEIFERAWRKDAGFSWHRILRIDGRMRFAVGVAAGFLLGLALHFVLASGAKSPAEAVGPQQVVKDIPPEIGGPVDVIPTMNPRAPRQVTREVDWYVFTDQSGNPWLIEGLREGMAKPVSFRGEMH